MRTANSFTRQAIADRIATLDVPAPPLPVEITLKRERCYPCVARPGPAWTWTYSWTTPEDVWYHEPDGAARCPSCGQPARRGPKAGQFIPYGQGLTSLRDMLRRKYGPAVRIIEPWKSAPKGGE